MLCVCVVSRPVFQHIVVPSDQFSALNGAVLEHTQESSTCRHYYSFFHTSLPPFLLFFFFRYKKIDEETSNGAYLCVFRDVQMREHYQSLGVAPMCVSVCTTYVWHTRMSSDIFRLAAFCCLISSRPILSFHQIHTFSESTKTRA